jgi:SAM-dependent methyltransferase
MRQSLVRDAYSAVADQYIELFDNVDAHEQADTDFIRRHLSGVSGPVLDLGCGPGHWTAYLHATGTDVSGIDLVPEFVAHARANHPGPDFHVGSMTCLEVADRSVSGILAWYSTIHLAPPDLDVVLSEFRRLLTEDGVLVIGFFDSDTGLGESDHKVTTGWQWPIDLLSARLAQTGLVEVGRLQHQSQDRPDRKYAAIAASAR